MHTGRGLAGAPQGVSFSNVVARKLPSGELVLKFDAMLQTSGAIMWLYGTGAYSEAGDSMSAHAVMPQAACSTSTGAISPVPASGSC